MATQNYSTAPGRRVAAPVAAPVSKPPIIASAMGSPMAQTRRKMQTPKPARQRTAPVLPAPASPTAVAATSQTRIPQAQAPQVPTRTATPNDPSGMARKKITF